MIYTYKCNDPACLHIQDEIRPVADRHNPVQCIKCKSPSHKIISNSKPFQIAKPKDTLITDFGEALGEGERSYTRKEYIDRCKKLDRDPVGLTFNSLKPT